MAIVDPKRFKESEGCSILVYGPEKCGKTTSVLSSIPTPCAYVWGEKRSLYPNLKIAGFVNGDGTVNDGMITIYEYDDIQSTNKFIQDVKNNGKYKSIVLDSATDIMRIELNSEIISENNKGKDKNNISKLLMSEFKQTQEGYGIANNAMASMVTILRACATEANMVVVAIARLDEQERKVNGSFREVPLLMGKDFLRNVAGMFDMIGRVRSLYVNPNDISQRSYEPRPELLISYPPIIDFETSDRFMSGWTGPGTQRKFRLSVKEIIDSNK